MEFVAGGGHFAGGDLEQLGEDEAVFGGEGQEQAEFFFLDGGDRFSTPVDDAVAGGGGDAGLRREDAGQVERIAGPQHQQFVGIVGGLFHFSQLGHNVGQGELFAGDSFNKPAAADFAARF